VRKLAFILFFCSIGVVTFGQQLPLYSQYLFNKFLINPAVAGSDGYTSISLTAREQWVGYYGAPRTVSLAVQSRMLKKGFLLKKSNSNKISFRQKSDGKVGLGAYVFNDKNGLVNRTGAQVSYAYHMWVRSNTQLSLGLAFTGYHYKIDDKKINFEDPSDPLLYSNLRHGMFVPDATFGVYLLNAKYSLGISADQLFEASAKIGKYSYRNFTMDRHYYIFGSYDFDLDNHNVLEPSLLLKMSEQLKPQLDIGATYKYKQDFWLGLSYRTSGALIANAGVKYENIFIGYAFDYTTQEIQQITYGTHEITIALKFGDSSRRYRWLDRY